MELDRRPGRDAGTSTKMIGHGIGGAPLGAPGGLAGLRTASDESWSALLRPARGIVSRKGRRGRGSGPVEAPGKSGFAGATGPGIRRIDTAYTRRLESGENATS